MTTREMEFGAGDRTVVLSRRSGPSQRLTDTPAPRFEQLEERMVHAARVSHAERMTHGVNTLVGAAQGLLSEIVVLKTHDEPEELHSIQHRLAEEVRQFEYQALNLGLEQTQVMAARYVLCTATDEAVVTTAWGNESEWSGMSLLATFHNETFGGEKFFQLLERLSQNPARHLDMLELMYVCLSLGFEGRYRVMPRGLVELEAIRDNLYRQIRQLRGDVPQELSPSWKGLPDNKRRATPSAPGWLVLAFTLVSLTAMYAGFAWMLADYRHAVLEPYRAAAPFAAPDFMEETQ